VKTGANTPFWAGQYELAEKLLTGRSLAFFRSELIASAFSTEHFAEILPLYNHFLQKNTFKIFDDKIEGLYQKYARVFPGAAAPAFDGTDQSGAFISLDQYRGKVVYLNFWASWCGACLKKMEFFDEFETELTANNIAIVNISIDEQPAQWQEALKTRAFKGRHVLASSGTARNIALAYDVQAVPQYFIIGKTGLFESKAPTSQPNDVRQTLLDISARGH
jgi:thiol-disulfide isomerase/thioredoxin